MGGLILGGCILALLVVPRMPIWVRYSIGIVMICSIISLF